MSINDLLDSEVFLFLVLVAIGVGMVIVIRARIAARNSTKSTFGNTYGNIYGDYDHVAIKEENNVKIIARRTAPHPFNEAIMINMVVFELSNGTRLELAIRDTTTYGIMIEGDCGTLKHQGKKFISFERSRIGEA